MCLVYENIPIKMIEDTIYDPNLSKHFRDLHILIWECWKYQKHFNSDFGIRELNIIDVNYKRWLIWKKLNEIQSILAYTELIIN